MVLPISSGLAGLAQSPGLMRRGGKSSMISRAVAAVIASRYKGYGPLLDEGGRATAPHDFKLGSVGEAFLTGKYLRLWGSSGHYAEAPDSNALDITGDLTLVVDAAIDVALTSTTLVSKYTGTAATSSFVFQLTSGGVLRLYMSDGAAITNVISDAAHGVADGVRAIFEVQRRQSDGRVQFFKTVNGVRSQIGTDRVLNAGTAIAATTATVKFGTSTGTTDLLSGRMYSAQIYSGLGTGSTKAFDANFAAQPWGTQHFVESSANAAVVSLKPGVALIANGHLQIPATSGNYAAVADSTELRVTGDIDIRWFGRIGGIAASGASLVGKTGGGSTRSYRLQVSSLDRPQLGLSFDGGSTDTFVTSTITLTSLGVGPGVDFGLRGTFRRSDGRVQFFYSTNDGQSWTLIETLTTTVADIASNSSILEVGTSFVGTAGLNTNRTKRVQIFASLNDTDKRLDVSFSQPDGTDYFTATTGQTVRVFGTAGADTNDPYLLRYYGTPYLFLSGAAGNYASVPAAAALDVVGDLDLRVIARPTSWASGAVQTLLGKYTGTAATSSYLLRVNSTGTLSLTLVRTDAGDVAAVSSTVALPALAGQRLAVRATWRQSDGRIQFFYSTDYNADTLTGTWTQLGTDLSTVYASLRVSTSVVEVGSRNGGTAEPLNGAVERAQIFASINGTDKRLDIDFTALASYASHSSLTALTGQTVTINRSATGRKASVVEQQKFLLGTDDYFETPDHADLNIAAADSFSVVSRNRVFGTTSQVLVSKRLNNTGATVGWELYHNSGLGNAFRISDGVSLQDASGNQISLGDLATHSAVRDVVADTLETRANGLTNGSTVDTSTGTLSSTAPMRIGSYASALGFLDGEFYGMALVRSTLSVSDQLATGREVGV